MTALRSDVAHFAGGFAAMAVWAAFANAGHPMPAPLVAGLVQGILSASVTIGLKRLVEAVFASQRGVGAVVLPPLLAWAVSAVLLCVVHWLAGTPELLMTIVVPNVVATSYAAIYTVTLWRARKLGHD